MILTTPRFSEEVPAAGATRGHVRFTCTDGDPATIAAAGVCANAAATVLFERLQAHGTNIVISLRPDGAELDVLARTEEDGLPLRWDPKPMDAARLEEVHARVRAAMPLPGSPAAAPAPPAPAPESDETPVEAPPSIKDADVSDVEEDLLTKQLLRIP